jgi:Tol biopolymer transport system component
MPYPKWICLFAMILAAGVVVAAQDTTASPTSQGLPENLVVAWIENGSILAQAGNNNPVALAAGDNPMRPDISSDGHQIAYLHGDNDMPSALAVVDLADKSIHHLVTAKDLAAGEDASVLISQVVWSDNSIIYLNTLRQLSYGQEYREDLWQVNSLTGEITILLPPGEGGIFSLSPDHKWIAVISAGEYDREDSHIRLMNIESGNIREVLTFPAVSTGSEYRFYPQVFWQSDSNAFRVAIPDRDLIYDEVNKSAVLWQVGIDGAAEQIGQLSASFFGLPRWSSDGQRMIYLRRAGDPAANQFDLMLAAGNGDNPIQYTSGEAGSFGVPDWIPDSTEFIYAQGEPGSYWLGSPDTKPAQIPESMVAPIILTAGQIVYASAPVSPFELRYRQLGVNQSLSIAAVNDPYPVFDALLITEK